MAHSKLLPITQKQSAFSLSAIQVTGAISLPVLNSSIQLSHQFGFGASLGILLISTLLVWLLSYAIISMTAKTTKNTLENTRDYLGPAGAYLGAFTLLTSTIAWFILQTNAATLIVLRIVPIANYYHVNTFLQIGVGLGVLSTVACMEGINGLRRVATVALPIILAAFLGFLFLIHRSTDPVAIAKQFSIASLTLALAISLSAAVDYPTFFRHSRSKQDSIRAITLIQSITFLLGVGGLYLGKYIELSAHISGWGAVFTNQEIVQILFLIIIVLSCLCVNMVNVYSASIAWEMIVPIFAGRKEYTILGLGLTSAFVLITNLLPMHLMMEITEIILSNLCLVLVFGYLGKLWNHEAVRKLDKILYCLGWIVGSAIALYGGIQKEDRFPILITGFSLSVGVVILTFSFRKISQRLCHTL